MRKLRFTYSVLGCFDFSFGKAIHTNCFQEFSSITKSFIKKSAHISILSISLTNFLPAIQAVGYMESYMDWQLIFRDEIEMMEIARALPRNQIERVEMFVEKQENIVFLQIQKSK